MCNRWNAFDLVAGVVDNVMVVVVVTLVFPGPKVISNMAVIVPGVVMSDYGSSNYVSFYSNRGGAVTHNGEVGGGNSHMEVSWLYKFKNTHTNV